VSAQGKAPWERHREDVQGALAVYSDTISASEITSLIGIEPTEQRVKGQPVRGKRNRKITVVSHQWIWQPNDSIERSLDAQLNAIWAALKPYAEVFQHLPPEVDILLDIWISHYGSEIWLGQKLDKRHVTAAAAFGASISIDQYDFTEPDDD
jgi:hypothetical protein